MYSSINTEAEYIAATEASKEFLLMKNLLKKIRLTQKKKNTYFTLIVKVSFIQRSILLATFGPNILMCDIIESKMDQSLSCCHSRRSEKYLYTNNNCSEIMMKSLSMEKFEACWKKVGLVIPPNRQGKICQNFLLVGSKFL